jgi:hypothetical protein
MLKKFHISAWTENKKPVAPLVLWQLDNVQPHLNIFCWPHISAWYLFFFNYEFQKKKKSLWQFWKRITKYTVSLATCTSSMDTINVCLGLFSVHYQLKINFKADFSRSEKAKWCFKIYLEMNIRYTESQIKLTLETILGQQKNTQAK